MLHRGLQKVLRDLFCGQQPLLKGFPLLHSARRRTPISGLQEAESPRIIGCIVLCFLAKGLGTSKTSRYQHLPPKNEDKNSHPNVGRCSSIMEQMGLGHHGSMGHHGSSWVHGSPTGRDETHIHNIHSQNHQTSSSLEKLTSLEKSEPDPEVA